MAIDSNDQQYAAQPFLRQRSHPSSREGTQKTRPRLQSHQAAQDADPGIPAAVKSMDASLMKRIRQWSAFWAMAIQIDLPDSNEIPDALHEALADILASSAARSKAVWFHWKGPLYGYILPQSFSEEKACDLAASIQTELARRRKESVAVGMARYPLSAFSWRQTLSNACKALDHAAFFGPGGVAVFDAVSLNISGDRYYQNQRMQSAIAEYLDALRLNAEDINVRNSLGVCYAETQDYEAARQCFEAVLAQSPEESMAAYNLGVVHLLQDNHRQALDWFKKAYALNTSTFEIPYLIGKVLVDQNRFAQAVPFLEHAIALKSDSANAFGLLGRCLDKENKTREALAAYKRAVKLNPNDAAALSALGCLYDAKGENPDICLTFSRQSVALAPRNGKFRFRLACLYQKHGHTDLAAAEYDQAAAMGYDCRREIDELKTDRDAENDRASCCA